MKQYILKGKEVVEEPDVLKWAMWFGNNSRVVKQTKGIIRPDGIKIEKIDVSTVFIGIDAGHPVRGDELVFETIVFGGPLDQARDWCSTWTAAEKMHEKMCKKVRQEIAKL